jgi:hypothetical protein
MGKSATGAVSILFIGRISTSICPVAFFPHGRTVILNKQVVKNATVDLIMRGRQDEILALSFSV